MLHHLAAVGAAFVVFELLDEPGEAHVGVLAEPACDGARARVVGGRRGHPEPREVVHQFPDVEAAVAEAHLGAREGGQVEGCANLRCHLARRLGLHLQGAHRVGPRDLRRVEPALLPHDAVDKAGVEAELRRHPFDHLAVGARVGHHRPKPRWGDHAREAGNRVPGALPHVVVVAHHQVERVGPRLLLVARHHGEQPRAQRRKARPRSSPFTERCERLHPLPLRALFGLQAGEGGCIDIHPWRIVCGATATGPPDRARPCIAARHLGPELLSKHAVVGERPALAEAVEPRHSALLAAQLPLRIGLPVVGLALHERVAHGNQRLPRLNRLLPLAEPHVGPGPEAVDVGRLLGLAPILLDEGVEADDRLLILAVVVEEPAGEVVGQHHLFALRVAPNILGQRGAGLVVALLDHVGPRQQKERLRGPRLARLRELEEVLFRLCRPVAEFAQPDEAELPDGLLVPVGALLHPFILRACTRIVPAVELVASAAPALAVRQRLRRNREPRRLGRNLRGELYQQARCEAARGLRPSGRLGQVVREPQQPRLLVAPLEPGPLDGVALPQQLVGERVRLLRPPQLGEQLCPLEAHLKPLAVALRAPLQRLESLHRLAVESGRAGRVVTQLPAHLVGPLDDRQRRGQPVGLRRPPLHQRPRLEEVCHHLGRGHGLRLRRMQH